MRKQVDQAIKQLTRFYGIQKFYYDVFKQRQSVSQKTLIHFLKALDVPIDNSQSIIDFAREQTQQWGQCLTEPVYLAWDGQLQNFWIRLPETMEKMVLQCHLILENGIKKTWEQKPSTAPTVKIFMNEGIRYLVKVLTFAPSLPLGYHRLNLIFNEQVFSSLIISTPRHAFAESNLNLPQWGLFTPIYALNSKHNFGAGDFTDWRALIKWIHERGGQLAGTLPLFASFLDQPCEPSPYSPISRLLFNEFYLDVTHLPEFLTSHRAQSLFHSYEFQQSLKQLRDNELIDYTKIMTLKRQILEILSDEFFNNADLDHKKSFQKFIDDNAYVEDYAVFRAQHEAKSAPSPCIQKYYLFTQWKVYQQLMEITQFSKQHQVKIYLDMPLGVHPQGYDVWKEPELFAKNLAVGAPPDAVFTRGQNWGFAPLKPQALRKQEYRYFIDIFHQLFKFVDLLRIDHVMGMHRLYCIPNGLEPNEGAFLKYPAEELYAILCLESNRHQTYLVGENLGTVPDYVNESMRKHHLYRMYVLEYEIEAKKQVRTDTVPRDTVSSLNTHDMPTFAAYCKGLDLQIRKRAHLMTEKQAQVEWLRREQTLQKLSNKDKSNLHELLLTCLQILATSPSHFLLINLEDLWLETQPQNIPVSGDRYPNWRKKNRKSTQEWHQDPELCAILNNIARLRQRKRRPRNDKKTE